VAVLATVEKNLKVAGFQQAIIIGPQCAAYNHRVTGLGAVNGKIEDGTWFQGPRLVTKDPYHFAGDGARSRGLSRPRDFEDLHLDMEHGLIASFLVHPRRHHRGGAGGQEKK